MHVYGSREDFSNSFLDTSEYTEHVRWPVIHISRNFRALLRFSTVVDSHWVNPTTFLHVSLCRSTKDAVPVVQLNWWKGKPSVVAASISLSAINPKGALLQLSIISCLIQFPNILLISFWILFEMYLVLGSPMSRCFFNTGCCLAWHSSKRWSFYVLLRVHAVPNYVGHTKRLLHG